MKLLRTGLHEIESAAELQKFILENENLMVCCGRMGPMCLPVYDVMEKLEKEHPNIKFKVMAFDNPEASIIRNLPECRGFSGLPFTVYYKNRQVVHTTSSIQNMHQVKEIIKAKFGI
jgi:thioredoxin 1